MNDRLIELYESIYTSGVIKKAIAEVRKSISPSERLPGDLELIYLAFKRLKYGPGFLRDMYENTKDEPLDMANERNEIVDILDVKVENVYGDMGPGRSWKAAIEDVIEELEKDFLEFAEKEEIKDAAPILKKGSEEAGVNLDI